MSRKPSSLIPKLSLFAILLVCGFGIQAQSSQETPLTERERMLLNRIEKLESRINALEAGHQQTGNATTPNTQAVVTPPAAQPPTPNASAVEEKPAVAAAPAAKPNSPSLAFADGTTVNLNLDGYYGYNFNHPIGRVNLLRANDVTANNFSLNQVGIVVERTPDLAASRRFGYRLDLMFGQNTETLQGGAQNEARPQVYRNIYQAYGTYIMPIGSGLQLDVGKFASSLGYEGNYAKDQFNYSRSYYFNFLPFYHEGIRATYNLNSKLALQYWLVNGANQTEDFNGFKSQAVLLNYKPNSSISWNVNYYEGQEQRDVNPLLNPGLASLPTQPGLSTDPVTNRHDGRLQVIDSYASFNLGSKWTTAIEGDYVINRVAANSAPTRVYGGVGYLHRQLSKSVALNGRFSYLKDHGGLFSGTSQDLKDVTGTLVYQVADGLQTKLEYRRDFTNQLFYLTNNPNVLSGHQNTATLGLIYWFGGKTGSW